MKIAYAGAPGAFAHEACLAFASDREPVPLPDFAAVVSAVRDGEAESGMLPLRNSRAGDVEEVAALLAEGSVRVTEQRALEVRMHLMGVAGSRIDQIRTVTSHPMALRQCARSLARLGLAGAPASNTAVAARDLTERQVAVLASEAAATAYGLDILERDMQDDPENATTFVIIETC